MEEQKIRNKIASGLVATALFLEIGASLVGNYQDNMACNGIGRYELRRSFVYGTLSLPFSLGLAMTGNFLYRGKKNE
jgi:hypothetical protein